MRYVWDRFEDYFGGKPAPLRALIGVQARWLRRWDRRTAVRVGQWLPISTVVRERLRAWYGVPDERSRVLFPPVEVERFRGAGALPVPAGLESRGYDLVLSALVPYKRIDLAVEYTGPGAHCDLNGIYLLRGSEHVDLRAHERDPAVHGGAGQQRVGRGLAQRPGPGARHLHRVRWADLLAAGVLRGGERP